MMVCSRRDRRDRGSMHVGDLLANKPAEPNEDFDDLADVIAAEEVLLPPCELTIDSHTLTRLQRQLAPSQKSQRRRATKGW